MTVFRIFYVRKLNKLIFKKIVINAIIKLRWNFMKKKQIVDLVTNLSLLILACVILLFPSFKITDIKLVLGLIFGFYTLFKLTSFILIIKEHDYENLFTSIVSLGCFITIFYLELTTKNIALILLIWLGLMSLVKLKKADFYHDKQNKMWLLRLFILFSFIAINLILCLNLMYEKEIQILIIGFYFLINSLLDTIDPLVSYLMERK